MAGLLNRLRRFVDDDGRPLVLGFHAVGDAHTCTNPLYGRGLLAGAGPGGLLADALAAHPDDPVGPAVAYEEACARARSSPGTTRRSRWTRRRRPRRHRRRGAGRAARPSPMARVFVAAETDPVIGRALTRMMNLLATPAELPADAEFTAPVAEIFADPDAYPVPPRPARPASSCSAPCATDPSPTTRALA